MEKEQTFANHVFDKVVIPKIYKKRISIQRNPEEEINWLLDPNKLLAREYTHVTKGSIENSSTSLIFQKTSIKSRDITSHLLAWLVSKTQERSMPGRLWGREPLAHSR